MCARVLCVCVCVCSSNKFRPQRDDDLNELSVAHQLSVQTSGSLMTVCVLVCVRVACVCLW